jgi:glutaredoxin
VVAVAEIVLYGKQSCPYCTLAKSLLTAKGQVWTEIDIETQPGKREAGKKRTEFQTGRGGVGVHGERANTAGNRSGT